MLTIRRGAVGAAAFLSMTSVACAAAPPSGSPTGATPAAFATQGPCVDRPSCERRAEVRLNAAVGDSLGTGVAELERFLQRMPKGGDLHNHLTGAVYAESYLKWAREDGLRLNESLTLVPASACAPDRCNEIPASPTDPLYEEVLRAWSMRGFQAGKESGHDHFFAAFAKFGVLSHGAKREPEMLAEAMRRAADDGGMYLEPILTIGRPPLLDIARDAGELDPKNLGAFEERLRGDGRWVGLVDASRAALAELGYRARASFGCERAKGEGTAPGPIPPACGLTVRYLAQVSRTAPLPLVMANALLAFEVSAALPALGGVALVSPEDDPRALRDYDAQMAILGRLKEEFRGRSPLRVTLHAGELTSALVGARDAEATTFHVRRAIEVAHADRIGHGIDVLGERDHEGLLREMHDRGVTVEVCLTSNATILGVAGREHPLAAYLAAGVPVVLATDDPGVSRSSLTAELQRAVTIQGLRYRDLKRLVRTSLEAAFVPGPSLWESLVDARPVAACPLPVSLAEVDRVAPACAAFLKTSARADLQWRLEQQLLRFEGE